MVGALAAFMSTLDSQLLALSSMITREIYWPLLAPERLTRRTGPGRQDSGMRTGNRWTVDRPPSP